MTLPEFYTAVCAGYGVDAIEDELAIRVAEAVLEVVREEGRESEQAEI